MHLACWVGLLAPARVLIDGVEVEDEEEGRRRLVRADMEARGPRAHNVLNPLWGISPQSTNLATSDLESGLSKEVDSWIWPPRS